MNGRTAQESRVPVNGAAANGTNGHAPQPEPHLEQAPKDDAGTAPSASWRPDQQVAEISLDPAPENQAPENQAPQEPPQQQPVPPAPGAWTAEVRDRPPVTPALGQFNTPVRVDEIAVAAMTLAEDLHAATQSMPDSVELRRFRRDLDQAATTFRELATKLEVTAGKLVRLAANEGQACNVGWGVCPEHGLTLMNIGETGGTCHVLGCGRPNEGEIERCEHPVAYRVVDAAGPALLTCAGHAIACRLYLDNPVITAASDSMELF